MDQTFESNYMLYRNEKLYLIFSFQLNAYAVYKLFLLHKYELFKYSLNNQLKNDKIVKPKRENSWECVQHLICEYIL